MQQHVVNTQPIVHQVQSVATDSNVIVDEKIGSESQQSNVITDHTQNSESKISTVSAPDLSLLQTSVPVASITDKVSNDDLQSQTESITNRSEGHLNSNVSFTKNCIFFENSIKLVNSRSKVHIHF